MTAAIFVITLIIGVMSWDSIQATNLFFMGKGNFILPYGVILFAYTGAVAVPVMRRQLKGNEKIFPKSIIFASVIVFVIYLLFTVMVIGVTGQGTTEIATIGLGEAIGPKMFLIGNLLAFFTMGTSFLTLGLGFRDLFRFDYKMPALVAWLIVVVVPLTVFILGARDFIKIIGLIGAVLSGTQTIIIVLTYWKARQNGWRKPEFSLGPMKLAGSLIILIFSLGVVFSLINI